MTNNIFEKIRNELKNNLKINCEVQVNNILNNLKIFKNKNIFKRQQYKYNYLKNSLKGSEIFKFMKGGKRDLLIVRVK